MKKTTQDTSIPFSNNSLKEKIEDVSKHNTNYVRLKERIQDGKWKKNVPIDRLLYKFRHYLTVENNLIYYRTRMYVPSELKSHVLDKAHETHQGQTAMTNNISTQFWWPNMTIDVHQFIKRCRKCAEKRPINKSHLGSWPQSDRWERLHIDWCFPPEFNGPVLIIVDAGTNFIDAMPCKDRNLLTIKRCLSRVFGFFGTPTTIVADNAPEFIALKQWLNTMGIRLLHSPPYNPASNGQAERSVKTIKDALKCYETKHGDKFIFLQKILLNHRACSGTVSPAERLYNYKPRTALNQYFAPGEEMVLKNKKLDRTTEVKYLVQAGNNTAWVKNNSTTMLASLCQLEPILHDKTKDVQTPKGWKSKRKKTKTQKLSYSGRANVVKSKRKNK